MKDRLYLFFKGYGLHICAIILFFIIVFVCNPIQEGYQVALGDHYRLTDTKNTLYKYYYTRFDHKLGRFNTLLPSVLRYQIVYWVSYLIPQEHILQNIFLLIRYILGYFGAIYMVKNIFNIKKTYILFILGLFYVFNPFTLNIYGYSRGRNHHFLIYVFLPFLVGSFAKLIIMGSMKDWQIFILLNMISFVSYNNIAWFAVLIITYMITLITLYVRGDIDFNKNILYKFVLIGLIYIFLYGWYFYIFYISNIIFISDLTNNIALGGGNLISRLKATSSSMISVINMQTGLWTTNINNIYFVCGSLLFIFMFISYLILNKDRKFLFIIALLLIAILFGIRLHPEFINVGSFIYQLPGFSLFRSPDKLSILVPILYLLVLGHLLCQNNKRYYILSIIALFLYIIPFVSGGIMDRLKGDINVNYSGVIQIPDEYNDIKDYLVKYNKYKNNTIFSLPWFIGNSLDWDQFPTWNFLGQDILSDFLQKKVLQSNFYTRYNNGYYFPTREVAYSNSPDQILSILQSFGTTHIINHKDGIYSHDGVSNRLQILGDNGYIKKVLDNDYFEFYELEKQYINAILTANGQNITWSKINPSKYIMNITGVKENISLSFLQSYSPQWKIYPGDTINSDINCSDDKKQLYSGNTTECLFDKYVFFQGDELSYLWKNNVFNSSHKIIYNYANGWTIDRRYILQHFPKNSYIMNNDGSIDVSLVLYFYPQSSFYAGIMIYILSIILIIMIIFIYKIQNKTK